MKPAVRNRHHTVLTKSAVGRAELLRGLWLADQHAHPEKGLAHAAGYVRQFVESEEEAAKDGNKNRRLKEGGLGRPGGTAQRSNPIQAEIPRARFWAVTERVPLPVAPHDDDQQARASVPLVTSDLLATPDSSSPAWQPIAPPARLMPALKRSLQAQWRGGLDIAQLVRTLSNGGALRHLPRRAMKGWTNRLLVVLDMSEPLLPYRLDMHQLAGDLRRWVGHNNVKVRVIGDEHRPLGPWLEWNLDTPAAQRAQPTSGKGWSISAVTSRVLLVSELGLMARDGGQTSEAWAAWLHELGKQGAAVQVWCPVPLGLPNEPEEAPPGWQRAAATMPRVPAMHWSAAGHLRLRPMPAADLHRTPERMRLAQQLRTRLATVSRTEPALLRALRLGMGASAQDAGLEHLAWDHPDMSRHYSARALTPADVASYRADFGRLSSVQKLKTLDAVLAHHTPHNPLLAHVETLAWAAYATLEERRERQVQVEKAMDVMRRFAHDPWQLSGIARAEVTDFVARHLRDADVPTRALCSPYMSQLLVALHRERHGDKALVQSLDGLAASDVAKALGHVQPPMRMWLSLDDAHGWLMLKHEKPSDSRLLDKQPVELQALSIYMGHPTPRWVMVKPPRDIALARLPWGANERQSKGLYAYRYGPFPPPLVDGRIRLDTGSELITIEEISRPTWALEWARDREALYALAPNPWGTALRVHYPKQWLTERVQPLFHMIEFTGQGGRKADAFTLDLDAIGLIAGLTIKEGVTQSFRYLPPGQFLMGSPPDEPGRGDFEDCDEGPQHQVTLTDGFWLADTACTQGLWLAVMGGKNPSHFTGDPELPVEQVSWEDVQQFLVKLQAYLPADIEAVLPTEAQWEYACRAGAGTPFSYGEQINVDQVNYDGNYPYGDGARGKYRERTVPVKTFSTNVWGLYEMHGNVWEWCADSLRRYTTDAVTNPRGAFDQEGERQAVRGGCWFDRARFARSAQRDQSPLYESRNSLGFRFGLRLKSKK